MAETGHYFLCLRSFAYGDKIAMTLYSCCNERYEDVCGMLYYCYFCFIIAVIHVVRNTFRHRSNYPVAILFPPCYHSHNTCNICTKKIIQMYILLKEIQPAVGKNTKPRAQGFFSHTHEITFCSL